MNISYLQIKNRNVPFATLEEVDSTNVKLQALFENEGWEEGFLLAARQTSGKGRLGRTWNSQEGGMYLSMLLPSRFDKPHLSGLFASLVLAETLRKWSDKIYLKWPNDIVVCEEPHGVPRKLGGVLSSLLTKNDSNYVIVGLGCNLKNNIGKVADGALEPITLQEISDWNGDVISFAKEYCQKFLSELDSLETKRKSFRERYESILATLGKEVSVQTLGDHPIRGKVVGIDDAFGIIVADEAGNEQAIHEGDCLHTR